MTTAAPELVQPTWSWVPERRGSYGDEAIDLARLAGKDPDAEQCRDVDAFLSYGAGGRWTALEQAIVEARQNGKTTNVLEIVALFDLFMLPPDRMVWTAHLFKTCRESFDHFDQMIAATPELSRRVKNIGYSHGEETIELHHPKFPRTMQGAVMDFLARSKGGGRGLGGKRVTFDEALILPATVMGAVFPVLSARPDPQVSYGGSAGNEKSDHWRKLRKRGRAGGDPSLIYVEYSDDATWEDPPCEAGKKCTHLYGIAKGCALDDEERWLHANHTLGRRITIDYVRAERRTLPPREFGRERCGWWEDPPEDGAEKPIDMDQWRGLADPGAPAPSGPTAIAVEVAPGRGSTSIGVAWWAVGRPWVMVTELEGTKTAVATVKALRDEHRPVDISLHAGGPAGFLLKRLVKAGVDEVRAVSTQEAAQATAGFRDLVENEELGHLGQGELTAEAEAAVLRNSGDGEVWDRRDEDAGSIANLWAATLALQGLLQEVPEGPVEIEGPLMVTRGD